MELPPPPAWFAEPDLVPPPVPANKNLRSFGSPDLDEGFWDAAPPGELCGDLKRLSKEAVLLFCGVMRKASEGEEEAAIAAAMREMDEKFADMHARLGSLRIAQGKKALLAHLRAETAMREAAAARLRAKAAAARDDVRALLDAPDEPMPTDPGEEPEAVQRRALAALDEFHAHEAAEHARACLDGHPPPPLPPWDRGDRGGGPRPPRDDADFQRRAQQMVDELVARINGAG